MSSMLPAPRNKFNLETPIAAPANTLTAGLDAYRALSSLPPPAPFAVQPSGKRIEPEPRYMLLEEWVLGFTPGASSTASSTSTSSAASDTSASTADEDVDVLPSRIYKNATVPRAVCVAAHLACVARRAQAYWTAHASGSGSGAGREARAAGRGEAAAGCGTTDDGAGWHAWGRDGWEWEETGAAPLSTSSHVFPGIAHPAGD
ncbi:hypothetical protein DFH06DRAFT_1372382 [Mycena polygramma]|nr:hypothetical protein DFH06DRAFT_1372382 [Mycena polygramma]